MIRRMLVLSLAVISVWQTRLLAVCPAGYPAGVFCGCPSGNPDEIFCEDFDTYCDNGGWPGGAGVPVGTKCSSNPLEPRTPGGDEKMRSVWFQTSTIESGSPTPCGTPAFLEDSQIQVTTPPFAGEFAGAHGQPMAQHTFRDWELSPPVADPVENQVLNLRRFIRNRYGTQYDALTVIDDNDPLVLTFSLDSLSDGKIYYTNGFVELAYGPPTNHLNRANTDYALHEHCYTYCDPYINQGPFPIVCAYGLADGIFDEGCPDPDLIPPPLHNAVAIGLLPMLDWDPCHCGSTMAHGGQLSHPVFFNGRKWYNLRSNNPAPSGGTITPLNGSPMPPPPLSDSQDPAYNALRVGRFALWQNPLTGGTNTNTPPVDKPYNWLTLKIKTGAARIELRKIVTSVSNPAWKWVVYEWMDNVPLDYRGPFDTLRMGVGAGCQLASNTSWECAPGSSRTCIDCLGNQAYFADFDDLSLYGGAPFQTAGACCFPNGTCTDGKTQTECAALTGVYRGPNTTCGADPNNASICLGACCNEQIACSDTKINACPFDWRGYGTNCEATQCPCNDPFADADGDGDVDQLDFSAFQDCFAPGTLVSGGTCKCFDVSDETGILQPDNEVGGRDLARFEQCASGPGIPHNPTCDQ